MPSHESRRGVIVGAASGIGAAGARRLAQEGWRLALVDRAAEALATVEAETGAVVAVQADAADPPALAAAIDRAVDELGGLDAAWSNVGVQLGGDLTELSVADLDRSYAVNLRSHFVVAKRAAESMDAGAAILITASNSGLQTEPHALAYATTKAAAIALVRGMARDLAPRRIRVNALCPGYVDTPFNEPIWSNYGGREGFLQKIGDVIPLGRMASPEEIAELAHFLLSDRSAYMTGHALVADGGEIVG